MKGLVRRGRSLSVFLVSWTLLLSGVSWALPVASDQYAAPVKASGESRKGHPPGVPQRAMTAAERRAQVRSDSADAARRALPAPPGHVAGTLADTAREQAVRADREASGQAAQSSEAGKHVWGFLTTFGSSVQRVPYVRSTDGSASRPPCNSLVRFSWVTRSPCPPE